MENMDLLMEYTIYSTYTGKKYIIKKNEELVIGKVNSSVIESENVVTNKYTAIKHEYGQFIVYDINSPYETFINNVKLQKGREHFKVLKVNDVITVGDDNYKYILHSPIAILDDNHQNKGNALHELENKIKNCIESLNIIKSELVNLSKMIDEKKKESNILNRSKFDNLHEFYSKLDENETPERLLKKLQIKDKKKIEKIDDEDYALMSWKKIFFIFDKTLLHILRSYLECSLCKEISIEASSLKCSHVFCHVCIFNWFRINSRCPVCSCPTREIYYCSILNNFISNVYETIGGSINEEREELVNKRSIIAKQQELVRFKNIIKDRAHRLNQEGYPSPCFVLTRKDVDTINNE